MSNKSRYFHVVFIASIKNQGNSQATGTNFCEGFNGRMFNQEEFIRDALSRNKYIENIVITNWIEFDSKEDYEAFYD